jgi:hypothetical protein
VAVNVVANLVAAAIIASAAYLSAVALGYLRAKPAAVVAAIAILLGALSQLALNAVVRLLFRRLGRRTWQTTRDQRERHPVLYKTIGRLAWVAEVFAYMAGGPDLRDAWVYDPWRRAKRRRRPPSSLRSPLRRSARVHL